jgi:hypothetical protein
MFPNAITSLSTAVPLNVMAWEIVLQSVVQLVGFFVVVTVATPVKLSTTLLTLRALRVPITLSAPIVISPTVKDRILTKVTEYLYPLFSFAERVTEMSPSPAAVLDSPVIAISSSEAVRVAAFNAPVV